MTKAEAVSRIVDAFGAVQNEYSSTVTEDIAILDRMVESLAAFGVTLDDILEIEDADWVATTLALKAAEEAVS